MNDSAGGGCADLEIWLGGVDIYLIDQILKGRFPAGSRILEAGCGGGRNLLWFLRSGYDVSGVDSSPGIATRVGLMASQLGARLPVDNFRTETVERMSFESGSFDAVLSIAVLHFARDEAHFLEMLHEMWRVLRPGGVLFVRLASTVGIEHLVVPLAPRRFEVPDGSIRFLVDIEMLLGLTSDLGADLLEPVKTVNVQNMRCMTNWVLRKSFSAKN